MARTTGRTSTFKQLHELTAAILNHNQARGTELVVLLAIAHHARLGDDGRWTSYPGVRRLANYGNVSERAVQLALRKLVDTGQLVRLVNAGGSGIDARADQRPNLFVISNPCPPGCDPSSNHRSTRQPRAAAPPATVDRQRQHAANARAALARNRETG